ncbi:hypothetical protein MTR67_048025 [Solanum verrucosum]|uniref:Uncharacterized protein n=1 Tax=Solanum verrucosum TaxID=315347 RepID=A0AAF0UXK1_SOLVR|nr:hypothetical protein MTR67_048025 [Solanum verrucosum]
MAENASTGFNVHVPKFVDAIWVALRDPTLAVREKAVETLRACIRVIEKRETRWRVQCWGAAKICMNHIPHVLKIPTECASGFIALGEMAVALDGELINYLPTITSHLRDVGWYYPQNVYGFFYSNRVLVDSCIRGNPKTMCGELLHNALCLLLAPRTCPIGLE